MSKIDEYIAKRSKKIILIFQNLLNKKTSI